MPPVAFDIERMPRRGLLSLLLIGCVCLASIAFLPFGAGPYTAVYGPTSALRAQRALALLWFVLLVLAEVATRAAVLLVHLGRSLSALTAAPEFAPPAPLSALRC